MRLASRLFKSYVPGCRNDVPWLRHALAPCRTDARTACPVLPRRQEVPHPYVHRHIGQTSRVAENFIVMATHRGRHLDYQSRPTGRCAASLPLQARESLPRLFVSLGDATSTLASSLCLLLAGSVWFYEWNYVQIHQRLGAPT